MTLVAREQIEPALKIGNMRRPEDYPRGLPVTLEFGTVATQEFDLEGPQTLGQLDFVQTIYVDNGDNLNALTLRLPGGQRLVIPATAQGFYPVVCPVAKFTLNASTTIAANLQVPIILMNVPVSSQQWGPITVNVASVTATFTPTPGEWSDASGSIAVGNTSQTLFPASATAIRRVVQNPSGNIGSLWINFGGVAASPADSIEITPGSSYDTATGPIDRTEWTIIAASTLSYIAKEMTP